MRLDCGGQHHFIGNCKFHLATFVDDILVSTVGDYYPYSQPDKRGTVGIEGFYETYVFKTDANWGVTKDEDEEWEHPSVSDWCEIDSLHANTARKATINHQRMVEKYS